MSIHSEISRKLEGLPRGTLFRGSSLFGEWPRSAVDQALSRMVRRNEISRLGRGIYVTSRSSELPTSDREKDALIEQAANLLSSGSNSDVLINPVLTSCALISQTPPTASRHQYVSATAKRSISILGQRVCVRRVSARRIPQLQGKVGMAITAIWAANPRDRSDQLMKIAENLSSAEMATLINSGAQIPGWAHSALRHELSKASCLVSVPDEKKMNTRKRSIAKGAKSMSKWTKSTVEGRWCGFGPYYAMFPVEFARKVIHRHCPERGTVIDPFSGRGTVPFVALATNRLAFASDINPVGWIFAQTKIDPCPDPSLVLARARSILQAVTEKDRKAENEFQQWAWSKEVLGFLNAARRLLSWRSDVVDRTLMATLLVHLHAKAGEGLSNQMRQSKAMAPEYSVAWWKKQKSHPPTIDIIEFLDKKLKWRYAYGIVTTKRAKPVVELGDAREALAGLPGNVKADLVFTSPPYCGVTNYRYDNWIRLWMLGESALPGGSARQRYSNKLEYTKMLREVFTGCAHHSKRTATIYVRTDARAFTLDTTIEVLQETWPTKQMYLMHNGFKKATQTALFGDEAPKPGEVDILLQSKDKSIPRGFVSLKTFRELQKKKLNKKKVEN